MSGRRGALTPVALRAPSVSALEELSTLLKTGTFYFALTQRDGIKGLPSLLGPDGNLLGFPICCGAAANHLKRRPVFPASRFYSNHKLLRRNL